MPVVMGPDHTCVAAAAPRGGRRRPDLSPYDAAVRHVFCVVGTRPNFMKTAPVIAAMQQRREEFRHTLVHTGQHYDDAMSTVFFQELGVGQPDVMLGVGSGSHARQTARVMERL